MRDQPGVERAQARHRLLPAQGQPSDEVIAPRLGFDGVEFLEPAQRFRGHRMSAGGVEVEELASGMGQTRQLGDAQPEERFIAPVVIDHQLTAPVLEEVPDRGTAATGLIVEEDAGRGPLQIVAAIGPQISPLRLALAGVQRLDRCFVGVQHLPPFEPHPQAIRQGLKPDPQRVHPLGQRRAGDRHPWRSLLRSMRYRGK